ncbi:MAG: hypothetical protein M0R75_06055 [Dehalococcoidia bacterium]|nr:hypothetical protein [Dehalococcoidia bacterium]
MSAQMSWQDLVLAVGGFVIAAGIIPTIMSRVKPALMTSATIVVVLGVSTVAFASLGLWLTAAGAALQFVLWGIVLAQTLAARGSARDALAQPVDTMPPLGFEAFEASVAVEVPASVPGETERASAG